MADVSGRIYGPAQPAATNAVLYTVPALTSVIVRSIHICNTTGSPATVTLAINGSAATAANRWLSAVSVPQTGTYDWSGFLHLSAADTIQGLQSSATACTITISGVLTT